MWYFYKEPRKSIGNHIHVRELKRSDNLVIMTTAYFAHKPEVYIHSELSSGQITRLCQTEEFGIWQPCWEIVIPVVWDCPLDVTSSHTDVMIAVCPEWGLSTLTSRGRSEPWWSHTEFFSLTKSGNQARRKLTLSTNFRLVCKLICAHYGFTKPMNLFYLVWTSIIRIMGTLWGVAV